MRPSSPRRQRTPKVCINLTNCKYDLCEPSQSLPRRWDCAELAPRLVLYLYCTCALNLRSNLSIPPSEHTYWVILAQKACCQLLQVHCSNCSIFVQYRRCVHNLGGFRLTMQMNGMCSGLINPSVWQELWQCNQCRYCLHRTVLSIAGFVLILLDACSEMLPRLGHLESMFGHAEFSFNIKIQAMHWLQKINHFAGMLELCRKKTLARNISAMAAQFPGHFDFCPKTYVLPEDLPSLWRDFKTPKKGKPKTLILKPDSGSQVSLVAQYNHDQTQCTTVPLLCPSGMACCHRLMTVVDCCYSPVWYSLALCTCTQCPDKTSYCGCDSTTLAYARYPTCHDTGTTCHPVVQSCCLLVPYCLILKHRA